MTTLVEVVGVGLYVYLVFFVWLLYVVIAASVVGAAIVGLWRGGRWLYREVMS